MIPVTFTIEHRPVLVASDGRVFTDVVSAYNAYVDPMQHLLTAVERVSHDQEREEQEKDGEQEKEEGYTDDDLVGKRVAVYWDGNAKEFVGTVTRVAASSVFVVYNDGDAGWEYSWRVLAPCTRTPGCPKEAKHRGPCPGKRKCVETVETKRTRPPVQRLGHADDWGKGVARCWVSNA